jgi:hypothetical protein
VTRPPTNESRQLRTLERWRTVELENAQAEYAALLKIALDKQSVHERIREDIEAAQTVARDTLGRAQLSVEALRRLHEFAVLQATELKAAATELEQSQTRLNEGHAHLVEHFERLSVVERFKERRAREGMKDLAREDQKRLDEQAMTRGRPGSKTADTTNSQE